MAGDCPQPDGRYGLKMYWYCPGKYLCAYRGEYKYGRSHQKQRTIHPLTALNRPLDQFSLKVAFFLALVLFNGTSYSKEKPLKMVLF